MFIGVWSGNAALRLANWIELINRLSKVLFRLSISKARDSSFFHFVIKEKNDQSVDIAEIVITQNIPNDLVFASRSTIRSIKSSDIRRAIVIDRVMAKRRANSTAIIEILACASLFLSAFTALRGIVDDVLPDIILF